MEERSQYRVGQRQGGHSLIHTWVRFGMVIRSHRKIASAEVEGGWVSTPAHICDAIRDERRKCQVIWLGLVGGLNLRLMARAKRSFVGFRRV